LEELGNVVGFYAAQNYTYEIINWVFVNYDTDELTFIGQQLDIATEKLIIKFNGLVIQIKPPVDDHDLPQELVRNEVG
jgi:hypothetical protein